MPEHIPAIGLSLQELRGLFSDTSPLRRELSLLTRRVNVQKRAGAIVLCREPDGSLKNPSTPGRNKPTPKSVIIDIPEGRGNRLLLRSDIVLFVSSLVGITERPVPYDVPGLELYSRIQQNNPGVNLIGGTLSHSAAKNLAPSSRPTTTITLYTVDTATNTPANNTAQLSIEASTGMIYGGLDNLGRLYETPTRL
jgi:hypothetical protein